MTWLLILHIAGAGPTVSVGLMADENACQIAGMGMAAVLQVHQPDLSVTWTCAPEVAA